MMKTKLSCINALILDMDGVLWRADSPIGDLSTIFKELNNLGIKYMFATNNGSRTPEEYVDRLIKYGIKAESWQVITSALAVTDLILKQPLIKRVFVIGGPGLTAALLGGGLDVLNIEHATKADAVVMGVDRQITFEKMSMVALLVNRGVPFFATNSDKSFPTPEGEIPGAGAWISVITTATGINPIFAGKPEPFMLDLACSRLGIPKDEVLVVGDRLETDIAGGQNAKFPVALVLTGVSTAEEGRTWKPSVEFIYNDLQELVESLKVTNRE